MTTTTKKTGWLIYNTKRKKYYKLFVTGGGKWTKDIDKACVFPTLAGAYVKDNEDEIAIKVRVTTTTSRTVTKP